MREEIFNLTGERDGTGLCYIAYPDSITPTLPYVIAAHGSGREALSYREIPFYCRQRDFALDAGCAFAAVSNAKDTWGTDRGLERLIKLVQWMEDHGGAKRFAVFGSSAGGTLAFRLALALPKKAALILGVFPVIDLTAFCESKVFQNAWGNMENGVLRSWAARANPAAQLESLPPVNIVICHGTRDDVVPAHEHVLRFANRFPGKTWVHLSPAGHSIETMNLYDTDMILNALLQYSRAVLHDRR